MSAPYNKILRKEHRVILMGVLLVAWSAVGCAQQAPIVLPGAKIDRLAVQNDPNKQNGGDQNAANQLVPELDPFVSAEISSKALLTLASMPTESIQKLQSSDISAPAATPLKCGFVAGDEDIAQKLSTDNDKAGWTAVAGQGNFFAGVTGKTFSDCRCLVSQYASKHNVLLVPVSSD